VQLNQIKQIPDEFFDEYGLITERDGNGGDSANRMGLWMFLTYFLASKYRANDIDLLEAVGERFRLGVKHLEPYPYVFIRHPGTAKDCGDPESRDFACWNMHNVFSRDQWLMLMTGFAYAGMNEKFERVFHQTVKRHGTLPNGDILGPQHWAHLIRLRHVTGKYTRYDWAIRIFGDLWNGFGNTFAFFKPDASDTLVGFTMLLTAYLKQPTWISKLNLKMVKWFGNYLKLWKEYFDHDNGVPFHLYAEPLLRKYL
jgi:hypothetical protein